MIDAKTIADRYEIRHLLGEGGMGEVYLAFDLLLRRPVALKLLPLEGDSGHSFLKEARLAARLSHPNVVTVHDVGTAGKRAFIAMEYVEGDSLGDLVQSPQPWPLALEIAKETLKGLEYAHHRGIIHRDIKPSNLIRTKDGRVVLLDLGISYALASTQSVSTKTASDGFIQGTPAYMAPEQICGEPVDARTDLFALGVVLYELLTGEHPFQASKFSETLARILHRFPPAPSTLEKVPAEVDRIVLKLLAKSPSKRYGNAGEALEAIEECRRSDRTVSLPAQAPKSGKRLVLALSLGLVLVVISSFVAVLFSGPGMQAMFPPSNSNATPIQGRLPQPEETPSVAARDLSEQGEARPATLPGKAEPTRPETGGEAKPTAAAGNPTTLPLPDPLTAGATPRATPKPTPRLAILRIIIDQPAKILIDGELVGEGRDRELRKRPGFHTVTAVSLDGKHRAQEKVRLSVSSPQTVRLTLAPLPPGYLRIKPPRRMAITVSRIGSDAPLAECPCSPLELAPGDYELRFTNEIAGFDATRKVTISSGKTVMIDLENDAP